MRYFPPKTPPSVNRRVLHLAIPNIVSNLSVPLLGAVDTALVGHLEEIYYLGALAIGGMIFNFLFWSFGFLRMGTTGLAAQAFGSEDRREMALILARVQMIAVLLGLLLLLLRDPIAQLAFRIIESSLDVERHALIYYEIRIWTAPAVLALYGLNGWFLGMQNATYPMVITIFLNLLNIVLNLFFIHVMGMTVEGVAWGSLLATWSALVLGLLLFLKRYRSSLGHFDAEGVFDTTALRTFTGVNRDIFIRTVCLIFVFSFFTAQSSAQGELVLAANTILMQLWMIASYGIDGFAFAAESLVGRYKGERNRPMMRKAIRYCMGWGFGLGLAGSLFYGLLPRPLVEIFTHQTEVVEHALDVIVWTVIAPAAASFCYIWDGVFIGATETAPMRNSMLAATILFFLPAWYAGSILFGMHGLWLAMVTFMIVRGLLLGGYALLGKAGAGFRLSD